ncbi:hypothetical protein HNQ03_002766 [Chryseobacterium sp. 16F]|uniref:Uncharacterized protein n=1 Tax=Frigoriflavimonas asaccharolytica TaxID=2735899 RepID=A0A8J8K6F1_9FLAO|nr:hypothetical protein [Frigoriflavimonas asaccharolytica]
MDRKDFLILFWNKYLQIFLLLAVFGLTILNFKNIIEISKNFGLIIFLVITLFTIAGVFKFILDEITLAIPIKIRSFFNLIFNYLEKISFFLPLALIIFLILNWQNETIVNNIFSTALILFYINNSYLKKIFHKIEKV